MPLVLAACSPRGLHRPDLPVDGGVISAYPFAPVALRIHPLTHIEARPGANADEQSQLILHMELLDRYGDAVKGLGVLHVELYKPTSSQSSGLETQELAWDVTGMDAPEANTRRFDIATRTYRVPLLAPGWVADTIAAGGWLKVRAVLDTPSDSAQPQALEDEFIVQG